MTEPLSIQGYIYSTFKSSLEVYTLYYFTLAGIKRVDTHKCDKLFEKKEI